CISRAGFFLLPPPPPHAISPLSLHDALPISPAHHALRPQWPRHAILAAVPPAGGGARQSAVRRAHRAGQGIRHVSGRAELVRGVGLVKRFGGIVANDAVDFVVAEGDLLGLIGPNGSGKTTLINMLTGHLEPDGGDVLVRGQRMSGRPPNVYAA